MKGVRVGDSPIGRAAYATHRFQAGETIGQVQGELIKDPEYGSDYCIELAGNLSLEPAAPFRFLNHSCQPNCELVMMETEDADEDARLEIWVETVAEIETGDQLTIDYAWPAHAAIPCLCGSAKCRGWVVALEQTHLLTARKLGNGKSKAKKESGDSSPYVCKDERSCWQAAGVGQRKRGRGRKLPQTTADG